MAVRWQVTCSILNPVEMVPPSDDNVHDSLRSCEHPDIVAPGVTLGSV